MSKDVLPDIKWLSDVEEQDYPAAESYLTILHSQDKVIKMMAKFRRRRGREIQDRGHFQSLRTTIEERQQFTSQGREKKNFEGRKPLPNSSFER